MNIKIEMTITEEGVGAGRGDTGDQGLDRHHMIDLVEEMIEAAEITIVAAIEREVDLQRDGILTNTKS
jgi:hypothetical protein